MLNSATTYMRQIQSFISTAIMDAKLCVSFFLISPDETTSQLKKFMKLLEKESGGPQR